MSKQVSIEPKQFSAYVSAAEAAGAEVVALSSEVRALIWTDYGRPDLLDRVLDENPQLQWVQLPFAGVDAFQESLKRPVVFTSAKAAYREPVAEHALALALSLARIIPERVRASSWGRKFAVSLFDADVLIVGAGGITETLIELLAPFRANITVLRNRPIEMPGANRTLPIDRLDEVLPFADFVFLATALTDETRGMFNLARFSLMQPTAYFINVARGAIVETDDLVEALNSGLIAGAGVDVTQPEPLPDGHPLWSAKNVIITPHSADTNEMVLRLFALRIEANVRAYFSGSELLGLVDPDLGY